jgi:alkylhydroperoxidase family enzyme
MAMDARPSAGDTGFLGPAPPSDAAQRLFAEDVDEVGFVMNTSRVWAHLPGGHEDLFTLIGRMTDVAGLTFRQRGVLVSATASTLGDPHCSLAWGTRLAGEVGQGAAAGVLRGDDTGLTREDRALARWARRVARDPNGVSARDVDELREVGYEDAQILAITLYVGLRIAFSVVNDALGARPDPELRDGAPEPVRAEVTYGRPPVAGLGERYDAGRFEWGRGESNP